jgi:hypothetical protein
MECNKKMNDKEYEIKYKRIRNERKLYEELRVLKRKKRIFNKDPKQIKAINKELSEKMQLIPKKSVLSRRLDALDFQPLNSNLLINMFPANQNFVIQGVPLFTIFEPKQFIHRVALGPKSPDWPEPLGDDLPSHDQGVKTEERQDDGIVATWYHRLPVPLKNHKYWIKHILSSKEGLAIY